MFVCIIEAAVCASLLERSSTTLDKREDMDLFSECSASSPEYDYFCEDIGSDDDFRPHTLPRAAKAGGGAAGRIAKKGDRCNSYRY